MNSKDYTKPCVGRKGTTDAPDCGPYCGLCQGTGRVPITGLRTRTMTAEMFPQQGSIISPEAARTLFFAMAAREAQEKLTAIEGLCTIPDGSVVVEKCEPYVLVTSLRKVLGET